MWLSTLVSILHLINLALTLLTVICVFVFRKRRTIENSMWSMLESIAVGTFLMETEIQLHSQEPDLMVCLVIPWVREIGFVSCYGSINMKLYRIMMHFRTRKAHQWSIREHDLTVYLLLGIFACCLYMAAYTANTLNYINEGYDLVEERIAPNGSIYKTCKVQWWSYVTETGELTILMVGIRFAHVARHAVVRYDERRFLYYALMSEALVSTSFYAVRSSLYEWTGGRKDIILAILYVRGLLTNIFTLLMVFVPKICFERHLNKDKHNDSTDDPFEPSQTEVEMTENDNNSDLNGNDEELIRLYQQLEKDRIKYAMYKNPHISKRKGGKKLQHRRFSIQSSIKGRRKLKNRDSFDMSDTNDTTEVSRSPEDSLGSNEEAPSSGNTEANSSCECSTATGIHCSKHAEVV
ncbi:probable G-protein coupled receptor 158 isoform X2 [Adelges cooleyi]|uniref:probable G-protein coupled receptor 158 isoform X2 n=1 Tax=Adelges cooleyi TaxID=133065 RepID=UPI0021802A19|nr:probable G-protein coupled receptor 158 isoform X2 [Adelges cooleyi]